MNIKKLLLVAAFFGSHVLSQELPEKQFVDGIAAVVEDNVILKSDLVQLVNMTAIQSRINPQTHPEEFEELQQNEEIIFEVNSKYFTFENTFPIEISWEDEFGNEYILNENIYVEVSPTGLFNKMIMFFNKILF